MARGPQDQRQTEYSPIQRKYISIILGEFEELFECKGLLENCEVRTHFHQPLQPIEKKGKQVPIHVLPKVEETIENLLRDGHIVNLGKCTQDCSILPRSFRQNAMDQLNWP